MYKKLDKLAYNEENMPKYIELKHRLDVTRVEMLNLFRIITYESILDIQEKLWVWESIILKIIMWIILTIIWIKRFDLFTNYVSSAGTK